MLEYDVAYDNEPQENPAQADLNYTFFLTTFLWLPGAFSASRGVC